VLFVMSEEVHLGDVDAIDEFCVISIFDEAAEYLSNNSSIQLSTPQKLQFYALFKQATVGPCNKPKPGLLEMVERAKWNAWKDLGKMTKEEAIAAYVQLLDSVQPTWREETEEEDLDQQQKEDKQTKNNNNSNNNNKGKKENTKKTNSKSMGDGDLPISPALSRPVQEDAVVVKEGDRDLLYWTCENNIEKVKECLQQGQKITQKNKDGQNAIHLSVDRGYSSLLSLFLSLPDSSSAVSAVDVDGLTPLHFACICDQVEECQLLIAAGADPDSRNKEGESCWDVADDKIKAIMKKAREKQQTGKQT